MKKITVIILLCLISNKNTAQNVLDKQKTLEKFTFWSNQDWNWYKENIPFLETPDNEIDKTYYYRWELATIHMVYGSPESGYAATEFIDRPWWSGSFGTISCAAAHQLYDWRWLRNQEYVKDFSNFWFKTPGAQPHSYTNWIGDAIWQSYKVNQDKKFITEIYDDLKKDYSDWEKEYWVEKEGMFARGGMYDGMETNINSRQTPQWFEGAPGYRPTFNAYMWSHANAISNIAKMVDDTETVNIYNAKANTIKSNFEKKNWDASRNFFFHRFQKDELTANKKDTIKANTLTYQDGPFAGNEHGRELMAYVPWYFNMIDDTKEFGTAWKFLMNKDYFYANYGPTTVERHDPQFIIAERCCVWSGDSWPFATSQTLKALSNVVNNYKNVDAVSKKDFLELLNIYTLTQRKDGKPYIAESVHPDTGSWDGNDMKGHSDHYYHSSYVDLIISDLIGIKPQANDSIIIKPLVPKEWDYFSLDNVFYHGHNISVVWDKTGEKYNQGKGFRLLSDGKTITSSETVGELKAYIPYKKTPESVQLINYAVNNSNDYYPKAEASFPGIGNPIYKLNDGNFWYLTRTSNQWSNQYSDEKESWASIDFGIDRKIEKIILYFVEDDDQIKAPKKYTLQYWNGESWKEIPNQTRQYKTAVGRKGNAIIFPELNTSKIRVLLVNKDNCATGISEIEAWGKAILPIAKPTHTPESNKIKVKAASASYTFKHHNVNTIVDGKANKNEQWTAFQSPNKSDWVQLDFNQKEEINTAYIYFSDEKDVRYLEKDNYNITLPQKLELQYWNGDTWESVKHQVITPKKLLGNALNIVKFKSVKTSKMRIVMLHESGKFTGIYELEFLEK
ncbi:MGH1-like glycoside hydrolase domain-containing protein [Thalassobellus citreus]|uniref:MGH1-like glycoside hydrolase domain-containing protein n=1 Tax=Thalassobellus citreus TaxID=3367752 RepID=UPI003794F989